MKKGDVIFGILMLITLVFLIISLVPKNYPTHCSDKVFNLWKAVVLKTLWLE